MPGTPVVLEDLVKEIGEESSRCISCGFCDSVCPTYSASDYDPAITARGRAQLGSRLHDSIVGKKETDLKVGNSFYSCLGCHACVQICPTGVDAGRISELGRAIVASSEGMKQERRLEAKMVVSAIMKDKNPLGVRKECSRWAEGVEFETGSDTLLYTGNMYQLMSYSRGLAKKQKQAGKVASHLGAFLSVRSTSFLRLISKLSEQRTVKDSMSNALRNIALMLKKSGVSYDYLGEEEPYPGTFLYDLGYLNEFGQYSRDIANLFSRKGFKRVITLDPHTHHILKDVFPKFVDDFDIEVVYYLDLIDTKRLVKSKDEVILHEPCLFSMSTSPYTQPEKMLEKVAIVSKPQRSGLRTHCCGGPDELLFGDIAEKVSGERLKQLSENSGGRLIVTACPICYSNLNIGNRVVDISKVLVENMSESGTM